MSGIQSGDRLARLEQLQARTRLLRAHARWRGDQLQHARYDRLVTDLQDAIDDERARLDRIARARPEVAAAVRHADTTVQQRLNALGVDAVVVKRWGVEQGLIPAVVRGRVSGLLVDAYAHAHQPQETP